LPHEGPHRTLTRLADYDPPLLVTPPPTTTDPSTPLHARPHRRIRHIFKPAELVHLQTGGGNRQAVQLFTIKGVKDALVKRTILYFFD